ncbi:hypothetical protein NQD34_004720 [Periophthalmus magnuspinnatus]|nr:hypothetical protein NQD34_004720 [Periophthalmus magnuspinnatus]
MITPDLERGGWSLACSDPCVQTINNQKKRSVFSYTRTLQHYKSPCTNAFMNLKKHRKLALGRARIPTAPQYDKGEREQPSAEQIPQSGEVRYGITVRILLPSP